MPLNAEIFDEVQKLLGSVSADEARERIAELDKRIAAMQLEQQKWWSLVSLKQQLGEATTTANGQGQASKRPQLRQAVLVIFEERAEGSTLALADIRNELRRRGWLSEGPNEDHRLQMTTSNMVRRGQLFRPRHGLYSLPPTDAPDGEVAGDKRLQVATG